MAIEKMRQNLIIGAGVTGLAIGYELVKRGQRVVILEKESQVGGLAKSFKYNSFIFDVGPHRFFTGNEHVVRFIKDVVEGETIPLIRDSSVYFKGKYYDWPLRPRIVFMLPWLLQIKTVRDLFLKKFRKKNQACTFKEYILDNYGPTLYNSFFKDYTEKFFNLSSDCLHADWAKSGMEKAIIDTQLPHADLRQILRLAIQPLIRNTKFLYPKGGMSSFCDKLGKSILKGGGNIYTGVTVSQVNATPQEVVSIKTNKGVFECSNLIWTAPIGQICG